MKNSKTSHSLISANMSRIIDNYELDCILTTVCNSPDIYYDWTQDYFQDLYITGCRSHEPLMIERWSYSNGNVILKTLKTDAERIFNPMHLSNSLLSSIADRTNPYNGLTYDQLTREFRKVVPIHPIYSGGKIADTYLFRYNRARQMFAQRNSMTDLMSYFGWYSEQIASKYVTSNLVYDPFNRN